MNFESEANFVLDFLNKHGNIWNRFFLFSQSLDKSCEDDYMICFETPNILLDTISSNYTVLSEGYNNFLDVEQSIINTEGIYILDISTSLEDHSILLIAKGNKVITISTYGGYDKYVIRHQSKNDFILLLKKSLFESNYQSYVELMTKDETKYLKSLKDEIEKAKFKYLSLSKTSVIEDEVRIDKFIDKFLNICETTSGYSNFLEDKLVLQRYFSLLQVNTFIT